MCQTLFMPPTSKLRRHIGLGLSVRLSVTLAHDLHSIKNCVRDRILKFGMWHEYIKKILFFLVHRISYCRVFDLFKVFSLNFITL